MKNQSLMVILEILLDLCKKGVAEIAILTKISTRFEVNNRDIWRNGGFGFFAEGNE